MKKKSKIFFVLFSIFTVISSVTLVIFFIWVSSSRTLTQLENSLFQVVCLLFGFGGSYGIGRYIAIESNSLHSRPAFRRILSLYKSLSRVAQETEDLINNENISKEQALIRVKIMVTEQIATADDAVNDWKDIIPQEVEEIMSDFRTNQEMKR